MQLDNSLPGASKTIVAKLAPIVATHHILGQLTSGALFCLNPILRAARAPPRPGF